MIKCIILCVYISLGVVWSFDNKNSIEDVHVQATLEDFESLQQFFDEFEADVSLDVFTDDLTKSIATCRQSFEKASEKIEQLIDSYPIEAYESELNLPEDPLENPDNDEVDDLFLSVIETSMEEKDILETTFNKVGDGEKPHYLKQAEIILHVMDHACLSLPHAFATTRFQRSSPHDALRGILKSLTQWMERWTDSIEHKFDKFIESCLDHKPCKPFLKKMIERWINFSELRHGELGEETSNILQQLLQDIKWDLKKHPHLSELQRLALSDQFDGFYQGEDDAAFDFAQKISDVEVNHKTQLRDIIDSISKQSRFGIKQPQGEIQVETNELLRTVPDTFLSVAFGSKLIQKHFHKLHHRYSQLVSLASAFSPALLRVGGSASNFLTFDPTKDVDVDVNLIKEKFVNSVKHPKIRQKNREMIDAFEISQKAKPTWKHPKHKSKNQYSILKDQARDQDYNIETCHRQLKNDFTNFTMTEQDLTFLANFLHDLGWPMLFDLNQFSRDVQNNWDPTNAKLIFKEMTNFGLQVYWQLGNEPNSYKHQFDWEISPARAALDYHQLKHELGVGDLDQFIVGPDVTRPRHTDTTVIDAALSVDLTMDSMDFLRDFLKGADDVLNAISFHQYYVDGKTGTLEEFLSPETMNMFVNQLDTFVGFVETVAPEKPIWITETADAWGGGAPGLSNRFAGGFLWLDKLGAAALGGVSCVIRQTLYGGCYALLDPQLNPYPDYWVSVLHKQLVGGGVLTPRTRLAPNSLRLYAHCLRKEHKLYERGSVVLFGMNTSNSTEKLTLFNLDLQRSNIYKYTLSAPQNDLMSRNILLNGQLLKPNDNGQIPDLIPVHEINRGEIEFLPYTMTFWAFPQTKSASC